MLREERLGEEGLSARLPLLREEDGEISVPPRRGSALRSARPSQSHSRRTSRRLRSRRWRSCHSLRGMAAPRSLASSVSLVSPGGAPSRSPPPASGRRSRSATRCARRGRWRSRMERTMSSAKASSVTISLITASARARGPSPSRAACVAPAVGRGAAAPRRRLVQHLETRPRRPRTGSDGADAGRRRGWSGSSCRRESRARARTGGGPHPPRSVRRRPSIRSLSASSSAWSSVTHRPSASNTRFASLAAAALVKVMERMRAGLHAVEQQPDYAMGQHRGLAGPGIGGDPGGSAGVGSPALRFERLRRDDVALAHGSPPSTSEPSSDHSRTRARWS